MENIYLQNQYQFHTLYTPRKHLQGCHVIDFIYAWNIDPTISFTEAS